jgi:hypothetical protein
MIDPPGKRVRVLRLSAVGGDTELPSYHYGALDNVHGASYSPCMRIVIRDHTGRTKNRPRNSQEREL